MFFFKRNAMISKRKVMKKISFLDHKNYSKKKRIVQSYNCNTDTVQCIVRSVLFNHNADTDIHSVQSDPDPHHWFFSTLPGCWWICGGCDCHVNVDEGWLSLGVAGHPTTHRPTPAHCFILSFGLAPPLVAPGEQTPI